MGRPTLSLFILTLSRDGFINIGSAKVALQFVIRLSAVREFMAVSYRFFGTRKVLLLTDGLLCK